MSNVTPHTSVVQDVAARLIHKGWGGTTSVVYVSRALHALGSRDSGLMVQEYGAQDVAAAIIYAAAQKNRYAIENPGAFVRWLLRNRRRLSDWQRSRVCGFLRRFRNVPEWARARLCAWIGERIGLAPRSERRKRRQATQGARDAGHLLPIGNTSVMLPERPPPRLPPAEMRAWLLADFRRRMQESAPGA